MKIGRNIFSKRILVYLKWTEIFVNIFIAMKFVENVFIFLGKV